jgi:hypothetical protein
MRMTHLEPEQIDPELDSVLRRNAPAPDPGWVAGLERKLLPRRADRVLVWRLPHVRLGAAFAAGLAALLVVLALAGVGPLGGHSADVRAKDDCKLVRVSRVERVPVIVEAPSGDSVVYRNQRVQRWERRCR